jgi:hypothetical protein
MGIKDARALLSQALLTLIFFNLWEDGYTAAYCHFGKATDSKHGQI